jgi:hypothetical protein
LVEKNFIMIIDKIIIVDELITVLIISIKL